ncbi:MAG: DUF4833 domain-containing protein [Endomicrobium sp.]|jgi:hypothetical protein|nr:DUF4833 domain-containing protein [Endomicrobium sp.]
MKKFFAVALFSLVLNVLPLYAQENSELFRIERNKNSNIVRYDADMSGGAIDSKNPVDAYWVLYAAKGQRAELSSFDKKAYGYKVDYNDGGYYDLTLKAVPDRNIKIVTANGEPKAEILIDKKEAYLSKVYVFAEDGFLGIPRVAYYTLYGTDINSGEKISEKIDVK